LGLNPIKIKIKIKPNSKLINLTLLHSITSNLELLIKKPQIGKDIYYIDFATNSK